LNPVPGVPKRFNGLVQHSSQGLNLLRAGFKAGLLALVESANVRLGFDLIERFAGKSGRQRVILRKIRPGLTAAIPHKSVTVGTCDVLAQCPAGVGSVERYFRKVMELKGVFVIQVTKSPPCKCSILGVEALGRQGAKTQEYLYISSFRNVAGRDASAFKV
jgi:hypothetical protein